MNQSEVMNFLNEVAMQFPDAISLASGRPNSRFFEQSEWQAYQQIFTQHYAKKLEASIDQAEKLLCQYGPSAGIIRDIIQQHIAVDENIITASKNIIVTNGCQEALTLLCLQLLKNDTDCVLTVDPSYIGFSGLVQAINRKIAVIEVDRVSSLNSDNMREFDWQYLATKVASLQAQGLQPKAIYINPDFNNPLAYRLNSKERQALLNICTDLNLLIIEDNPYSRFDYTNNNEPSLKALDQTDRVYHIGSFSKTFCPGVRTGYLIVPESHETQRQALISIKSLVSVNTSSLTQSVIGGFLLQQKFSLKQHMSIVNQGYQQQRDVMLSSFTKELSAIPGVSWNQPEGGFFVVLQLPFDMSETDVYSCAKQFNVICMPVKFFSLTPERYPGQIRLAFSHYEPEFLSEGVKRLAKYIKYRLRQEG